MGTKPHPADGAYAPTNNSYTSTTGRPFDFFTGISYRQLDTARKTLASIFRLAARSAKVSESIGREVFAKVDSYILTLWFPDDAAKLGYPSFTPAGTGGDSGGPLPSYEEEAVEWTPQKLTSEWTQP
ncbi:hypothetical protein RvY_14727-2 [Ramazzottius varieornatus]|uniref:Uncharacterized protein n=1 Tax=Ramazzottius varieornatus TaxID=947166 RepID=A0A1D1VZJ1_RAMVA|nr:hypothetical protein RvY_14727-2 [Ramazzottius varieornatus]